MPVPSSAVAVPAAAGTEFVAGESAPAGELFKLFGFTAEAVGAAIAEVTG